MGKPLTPKSCPACNRPTLIDDLTQEWSCSDSGCPMGWTQIRQQQVLTEDLDSEPSPAMREAIEDTEPPLSIVVNIEKARREGLSSSGAISKARSHATSTYGEYPEQLHLEMQPALEALDQYDAMLEALEAAHALFEWIKQVRPTVLAKAPSEIKERLESASQALYDKRAGVDAVEYRAAGGDWKRATLRQLRPLLDHSENQLEVRRCPPAHN